MRRCAGGSPGRDATISIHAPRAGCDHGAPGLLPSGSLFQSTHPVRGATRSGSGCLRCRSRISIHAPRAGCDAAREGDLMSILSYFNPRTPCGVRPASPRPRPRRPPISIHAPRSGCDYGAFVALALAGISIHAPRAGCDEHLRRYARIERQFQSTHPVRGATTPETPAERDKPYFNPRTPCGVRLNSIIMEALGGEFQSTHPVRGATAKERRKSIGLLSLFHKTSLPSGVLAQNPQTASRTERHFSVRSPRGIHVHFGFAPQIMSTPSGS